MKWRLVSGLLAICCAVAAVNAEEPRDGNWWRQQPTVLKAAYILGVMDGINAVGPLESSRMDPETYAVHRANVKALIGRNTTVGQIVEGVDIFYRDFRNRSIPVDDAFWSVTMAIAGVPQDAEMLAKMRQRAANAR